MAERRSGRSEEVNPGGRTERTDVDPAAAHQPVEPGGVRHDAGATNRASGSPEPARKPYREKSMQEIEHDIEHTRAEMGETIDAIEAKLSPERIKHEVKGAVHETIDSVQERFSPEHIKHALKQTARDTGRDMMDTIKENPVPSLIAGLSVGWLIMKGNERSSSRRVRGYGRRYDGSRRERYGPAYYETGYDEPDYYEADYVQRRTYAGEYAEDRSVQDRAWEKAQGVKEQAQDVKEQAQEKGRQVKERARELEHRVEYGARRAASSLEQVVYENPLAAGAIAIGAGALIGTLLPSTHQEDEFMGPARDEVVHRAEHVAEETLHKAEDVAQRTAQEAKRAAQDVAQAGKAAKDQDSGQAEQSAKRAAQSAQSVVQTAKQGAQEVKNEAKNEAKDEVQKAKHEAQK